LRGLDRRIAKHPLFALLHKIADAVLFDLALVGKSELFLYLNLYPETLAIEAVLVALAISTHGVEALPEILVRPAPAVVDAHRVVGRDRSIDERPALLRIVIAAQVLIQDILLIPPALNLFFQKRIIHASRGDDGLKELRPGTLGLDWCRFRLLYHMLHYPLCDLSISRAT
jgi:hypothetical protein